MLQNNISPCRHRITQAIGIVIFDKAFAAGAVAGSMRRALSGCIIIATTMALLIAILLGEAGIIGADMETWE